ncbi:MAG: hypothetical protein KJS92_00095 [Bacteroidetes bacterium]|nr:hypothetical protein [Bacteroidota bacterium]
MLESGLDVHLITAQQDIPDEFAEYNKRVHRFKSVYPAILQKGPSSVWGKLYYRAALFMMKLRVKGTVYDTGVLDIPRMLALSRKLIQQHQIKTLICTGAPFSYLYCGAMLKKEFPHLVLLSDFRDRWTIGFHYGIRALSPTRFAHEAAREKEVLRASDAITAACPDIIAYLSAICPGNYHLILNPVSDLLNPIPVEKQAADQAFTITCAGNIGRGCEPVFEHFLNNVKVLQERYPGAFRFVFIGNGDREMEQIMDRNPLPNVERHAYMQQDHLAASLSASDAFLLFQRPEMVNSVATKVYDYIKFRKPIIACVGPGLLSTIITGGQIGYIMDRYLDTEKFVVDMMKLKDGSMPFNKEFDYSEYTLDYQVRKVLNILDEAARHRQTT